ncbi:MAG: peptide deformylase [Syntrophomonadaceae bacterium]|nr:peptide deformylase [Syntrophomonadaceae bacterium]
MAVYQVLEVPDQLLRSRAKPVKNINNGVLRLVDNMIETMYEADGVGLAAPQIGVLRRVIVFDIGQGPMELINPEIIHQEGEQVGLEGCLSVPGTHGQVKRAHRVVVQGLNRQGESVSLEGEELTARVLQHEIDHLDGILYTDRAEWVKRNGRK